mmetsp:Transcript_34112/g.79905  ORF Transcript_34112/g.79905 Transcript_34112/m.79905 type:complete len:230 (+) Transcript_34112:2192-2881(+)
MCGVVCILSIASFSAAVNDSMIDSSVSSRIDISPACSSERCTKEARNASLYVSSRQPRALSPWTPSVGLRVSTLETSSIRRPGAAICATSGMTMSVPVKTHLSPALAFSTMSPRRMTSRVRGIEPAGISSAFSCTRTFCQSTKRDVSADVSSDHAVRLGHAEFLHLLGSVYLYCCNTGSEMVLHSSHRKTPDVNSGRTSEVRVTVPEKLISLETTFDLRSRTASFVGRL